jgi:AcrR family transcriptional regulator
MDATPVSGPLAAEGSRSERRKGRTRAQIIAAGEELFTERGYEATSMEDISLRADVAVRTIYLHFGSKAAVFLAHFEEWVDAFVDRLTDRAVDEPVAESIRQALAALERDGWADRPFGQMPRLHPTAEFLSSGPLEISGQILQTWARAQDRLTDHWGACAPPLVARARACAVFTTWLTTLLAVRDGYRDGTLDPGSSGNRLGVQVLDALVPPDL